MEKIKIHNLFSGLPVAKKGEVFQILMKGKGLKIERIVSCGQTTPEGRWLCSKKAEWVTLLKGRARLSFKKNQEKVNLEVGDYVFIPARTCHRVDWTHPKQKTVWLAVHIASKKSNQPKGLL